MLNRRNLFGAVPAIAVVAIPFAAAPVPVHAAQFSPAQSEAAAFEAALVLISPHFGPLARQAMSEGWKPSEIFTVINSSGGLPALMFERRLSEVPSAKEGFEGFLVRTTQFATYQHNREPDRKTQQFAFNPNRNGH